MYNLSSFGNFVLLYSFIEPPEIFFLIFFFLSHDLFLILNQLADSEVELLQIGHHPMEVIASRSETQTILYVVPNLSHFEMRVILDYFYFLLVTDVQFVLLKRSSQNYAEYYGSQVKLLHLVFYSFGQIGFCPCVLTFVNLIKV